MKKTEEIMKELERSKGKYRTIVQAGIAKWVKDFQDGRIKITTVEDLKKLIEMDIQILKDDINTSKSTDIEELRNLRRKG
ncbi:hypothetical protein MUG84_26580 [Paenibacillus sp. KQZ6P-2]|uniref:Uncharacterized protein n=1 Tax=Paenibacillus mangrovi TaxID=2931978 RepID=A0A9X2B513_9BACL|nr:hypothetical protein [Paenibacillus mangrovi]MCJ8015239.1 hypothetical protein [Paenibacillus mangrovi]